MAGSIGSSEASNCNRAEVLSLGSRCVINPCRAPDSSDAFQNWQRWNFGRHTNSSGIPDAYTRGPNLEPDYDVAKCKRFVVREMIDVAGAVSRVIKKVIR